MPSSSGGGAGSMPSDLANLIQQQMLSSPGAAGAAGSTFLDIALGGRVRRVPLHVDSEGGVHGTRLARDTQRFTTLESAVNSFYLLDDKYREDLQKKMWYLGLIDGPNNMDQALKVWGNAVQHSWNYKAAGKNIDPLTVLQRMTNLKAGQLGPGAGTRTVTQRQINFTDPEQAKAWIREAFQSSMGRDPHDAEIRAMLGAIAEGNRKQPQVMQSTTDINGNTTQRVVDPGFDPTAYIKNHLASDPEAAASQAASQLYPALIAALQSPV